MSSNQTETASEEAFQEEVKLDELPSPKAHRTYLKVKIDIHETKVTLHKFRAESDKPREKKALTERDCIKSISSCMGLIALLEEELETIPRRSKKDVNVDIEAQQAELGKLRKKTYKFSGQSMDRSDWTGCHDDDDDYTNFFVAGFDRREIERIETIYLPALHEELARAV
jgi:hypothetical protein